MYKHTHTLGATFLQLCSSYSHTYTLDSCCPRPRPIHGQQHLYMLKVFGVSWGGVYVFFLNISSFILFLQGKFMFSSWFFIPSLCSCTCRILSCQTFKEAVLVFFSATQLSTVWSIFPFDSCQSLKAPELKRKLWNDSLLVNSKF